MKYLKNFKDLPREWQLKMLVGALNSYCPRSTDCSITYDGYEKQYDDIKEKIKDITTLELVDIYFDQLNNNGIHNITRYFSKTFIDLEKKHNEDPSLNIWDYRNMMKLYKSN